MGFCKSGEEKRLVDNICRSSRIVGASVPTRFRISPIVTKLLVRLVPYLHMLYVLYVCTLRTYSVHIQRSYVVGGRIQLAAKRRTMTGTALLDLMLYLATVCSRTSMFVRSTSLCRTLRRLIITAPAWVFLQAASLQIQIQPQRRAACKHC